MGWFWMILIAALVLLILWRVAKIDRQGLELSGAAMMVALAGYAIWGSPGLSASPTLPRDAKAPDLSVADVRKLEKNQFSSEGNVLMLTDAMIRAGATRQAVGVFQDAVKSNPQSADLWVGMGNALVMHGGGMVSPAAEYAFEKAAQLSPNHPGPPFFMGLALAQSGKIEQAGEVWRALLARAPKDAGWVEDLKGRLQEIGQLEETPAQERDRPSPTIRP
ncbi:MAG: tetratricopeptide repeat protein [Sphingomonadales bacterium]|jgi:cytochrome c-type biogenesis protein CcmH|nr:tetratricopeptide repeat protein [Sphingomonadales bacterium]